MDGKAERPTERVRRSQLVRLVGTSRARVLIRQLPDHSLAHRGVNGVFLHVFPRGQISLAPKTVVRAMDALKENIRVPSSRLISTS